MSTEATTEVKANPYNAKHNVNQDTVERGTVDATSLAYKKETKTAFSNIREQESSQEQVDDENQKYKRTNWKKRYDDLRRYQNEQIAQWKEKEAELKNLVSDSLPKFQVPKTPEELATFKEQYPEVYDTIQTVAYQMAEEQTKDLRKKFESLQEKEATLTKREAEQALRKLQPDFEEIRELEDFHEWVKDQPSQIQDWLYKGSDPVLASRAIDMFKIDVGWNSNDAPAKPTKPSASAAEAVSIRGTTKVEASNPEKVWKASEIKAMDLRTYEKYKPDIEKAIVEGRVVNG